MDPGGGPGAWFGAPRAAEEQGLIGGQQVQPKSVKTPSRHPALKQAGAHKVWRERLKQLLQVPATLEACIEELHRGRWADSCRVLMGVVLRSMPWCFKRPERIRPPGCGSV